MTQRELFFKVGYVCTIPKEFGVEQELTQPTVITLCDDSTGCSEVDDYFVTEADTMICEVDWNKDKF